MVVFCPEGATALLRNEGGSFGAQTGSLIIPTHLKYGKRR
jgi:hypothetical protein